MFQSPPPPKVHTCRGAFVFSDQCKEIKSLNEVNFREADAPHPSSTTTTNNTTTDNKWQGIGNSREVFAALFSYTRL